MKKKERKKERNEKMKKNGKTKKLRRYETVGKISGQSKNARCSGGEMFSCDTRVR